MRHVSALALAGLLAASGCKHRPPPRAYTVTIENFSITPARLIVAPGDTVVWKNHDFVPHTSTARDHTWDSKSIDASGSFRFVAAAPGTHAYYCVYHPTMQGTIEVR